MQNLFKIVGGILLIILAFKALGYIFGLIHGILSIAYILVLVGTLLHILFNEALSLGAKVIWAVVVLLTNIVGMVLYFLFAKKSAFSI